MNIQQAFAVSHYIDFVPADGHTSDFDHQFHGQPVSFRPLDPKFYAYLKFLCTVVLPRLKANPALHPNAKTLLTLGPKFQTLTEHIATTCGPQALAEYDALARSFTAPDLKGYVPPREPANLTPATPPKPKKPAPPPPKPKSEQGSLFTPEPTVVQEATLESFMPDPEPPKPKPAKAGPPPLPKSITYRPPDTPKVRDPAEYVCIDPPDHSTSNWDGPLLPPCGFRFYSFTPDHQSGHYHPSPEDLKDGNKPSYIVLISPEALALVQAHEGQLKAAGWSDTHLYANASRYAPYGGNYGLVCFLQPGDTLHAIRPDGITLRRSDGSLFPLCQPSGQSDRLLPMHYWHRRDLRYLEQLTLES